MKRCLAGSRDAAARTRHRDAGGCQPNGDIFGGWLLSQMDLARGSLATQRAQGRCATVAVDGMVFHEPVFIGDEVSCYATLVRTGRTSMTVHVEAWRRHLPSDEVRNTWLLAKTVVRAGCRRCRSRLDQPRILVVDVPDSLVDRPYDHVVGRVRHE